MENNKELKIALLKAEFSRDSYKVLYEMVDEDLDEAYSKINKLKQERNEARKKARKYHAMLNKVRDQRDQLREENGRLRERLEENKESEPGPTGEELVGRKAKIYVGGLKGIEGVISAFDANDCTYLIHDIWYFRDYFNLLPE